MIFQHWHINKWFFNTRTLKNLHLVEFHIMVRLHFLCQKIWLWWMIVPLRMQALINIDIECICACLYLAGVTFSIPDKDARMEVKIKKMPESQSELSFKCGSDLNNNLTPLLNSLMWSFRANTLAMRKKTYILILFSCLS